MVTYKERVLKERKAKKYAAEKKEKAEERQKKVQKYNDEVQEYNTHLDYAKTGMERMLEVDNWLDYQAYQKIVQEALDVIASSDYHLIDADKEWEILHDALRETQNATSDKSRELLKALKEDVSQSLFQEQYTRLTKQQADQVWTSINELEQERTRAMKKNW